MSVLLEFSMTPLDKGESVSSYVARSLEIIDQSGLPYKLNPMGTVIEGEWDEVMAVVTACYQKMSSDCGRITTQIKIDARQGKTERLRAKTEKLEKVLGKALKQ